MVIFQFAMLNYQRVQTWNYPRSSCDMQQDQGWFFGDFATVTTWKISKKTYAKGI